MKTLLGIFFCLFIISVASTSAQFSSPVTVSISSDIGGPYLFKEGRGSGTSGFLLVSLKSIAIAGKYRGSGYFEATAYAYYTGPSGNGCVSAHAAAINPGTYIYNPQSKLISAKSFFTAVVIVYSSGDTEGYATATVSTAW